MVVVYFIVSNYNINRRTNLVTIFKCFPSEPLSPERPSLRHLVNHPNMTAKSSSILSNIDSSGLVLNH